MPSAERRFTGVDEKAAHVPLGRLACRFDSALLHAAGRVQEMSEVPIELCWKSGRKVFALEDIRCAVELWVFGSVPRMASISTTRFASTGRQTRLDDSLLILIYCAKA